MTKLRLAAGLSGICLLQPGICATPNFHFEGLPPAAPVIAFAVLAIAVLVAARRVRPAPRQITSL
ncbi:MAG: hypothetical protein WAU86_10010 [Oricola sp.]